MVPAIGRRDAGWWANRDFGGFQVDGLVVGAYYSKLQRFCHPASSLCERSMTSAPLNRLKDADCPPGQADDAESSRDDGPASISEAEAAAIRADKLKAIKAAIQAGDYDSDDVLHQALGKMIESVEKQE